MKYLIIIAFLYLSILTNAQSGTIKVKIAGVKEAKGKVQLCLFNSEDSFLDDEKKFRTGTMIASMSKSTYTFSKIPMGTYAILAYWDVNANDKMETNLFGIPKEEVGFSQNVFGTFGPSTFEDASFVVYGGKTTELVIIIKKPSHF